MKNDTVLVRLITNNANNNLAAFDDVVLPDFEKYFDELEDNESDVERSDEENKEDDDDTVDEKDTFTDFRS